MGFRVRKKRREGEGEGEKGEGQGWEKENHADIPVHANYENKQIIWQTCRNQTERRKLFNRQTDRRLTDRQTGKTLYGHLKEVKTDRQTG